LIVLALDFETKSRVNLLDCGTDVYASDPTTDILCCSFINKHNGQEWLWFAGEEIPHDLILALNLATEIEAHNARFDQLIYEYIAVDYGFPVLPRIKWVCTAAQCRVNALPANLDDATRAANSKHRKDHTGKALIRKLSIPQKDGTFNQDAALMQQMGEYCMKDSRAMVSLTSSLRPLSDADKRDWQANERINDRGVLVDLELAHLAQKYAALEKEQLGAKLSKLTGGEITKVTQTTRLLNDLLRPIFELAETTELMDCITKPREADQPVKYTLDKAARTALLDCESLSDHYREVIETINKGSASSVSKFTAMINRADPETGRVHGAFIFAGASQTQRYTSKGLQLHNMRRDCYNAKEAQAIIHMMRNEERLDDVMDTLAKLLRPAIIPAKGHKFVVGDWSAIEARVLPWLSQSAGGEKTLDIFRRGEDIYINTAASMGKGYDRQIGKVANLSLGFGGAVGAFQAMAKNYGLFLEDNIVQSVVNNWRAANPWCVKFWGELERAAVRAVRKPETVHMAGRIRYIYMPILGGTLMCILPNNTVIQYPYARIEKGGVTCMKASIKPKSDSTDEWPRMRLWGGFLAENVTQATAACLMRELLADMVDDDFPVVGHVHDEVILEVMDSEVENTVIDCQTYMETTPSWANGLPLQAVPEIFERYGK
tara:strand:- start:2922 stop:4901 length:1980 start_codon:yes stop_codon:yes gene_type:complete